VKHTLYPQSGQGICESCLCSQVAQRRQAKYLGHRERKYKSPAVDKVISVTWRCRHRSQKQSPQQSHCVWFCPGFLPYTPTFHHVSHLTALQLINVSVDAETFSVCSVHFTAKYPNLLTSCTVPDPRGWFRNEYGKYVILLRTYPITLV
jgi:hypothetical protein